jgi:hypothetical protein
MTTRIRTFRTPKVAAIYVRISRDSRGESLGVERQRKDSPERLTCGR